MCRAVGIVGLLAGLMACGAAQSEGVSSDEAALSEEHPDPSGAVLASCASPMMAKIFDASKGVIQNGSVPGTLYATSRNTVSETPYIRGLAVFSAMADMITTAEHEVDFQTYVYQADSDVSGELVAGIAKLAERRQSAARNGAEPVVVRMLLDVSAIGFGSKASYVSELGAKIDALHLDKKVVDVKLGMFVHNVLGNLHSKTLVVDGQRAIITDANAEKHHDANNGPWYDLGYTVEGEIAKSLLADFDFHWGHGNAKEWVCGGNAKGDDCRQPTQKLTRTFPLDLSRTSCLPMLTATRSGDPNLFGNKSDDPMDQAFLGGLAASRKNVSIITPDLNDDAMKKGLIDTIVANPDLEVDVILSHGFNDSTENVPGQGGDNQKNVDKLYDSLAAAGVTDPCTRLQMRWYSEDGIVFIDGNGPRASHAKYASFDDQVAFVGSGNMDTQSWNHSHEANIVVDSARITASWKAKAFTPVFQRAIVVDRCAKP